MEKSNLLHYKRSSPNQGRTSSTTSAKSSVMGCPVARSISSTRMGASHLACRAGGNPQQHCMLHEQAGSGKGANRTGQLPPAWAPHVWPAAPAACGQGLAPTILQVAPVSCW